jgi:Endonuclease/Exonuclease/phosphatase family
MRMRNHFLVSVLLCCCFLALFANDCKAQNSNDYKLSIIGFYNLENLFDTINDPLTNDEEFLPGGANQWNSEKYQKKLFNMATVLSKLGADVSPQGFTALGVAEVECKEVLEDLCKHPLLASRNLQVVHHHSPDERGIDVGLLYNPSYFKLVSSRSVELALVSPKDGKRDFTRDMLHVCGTVDGDTMHILVNHWPSRRGGEKASEWARIEAAKLNRAVADSLLAVNPLANIIIMGDLNDDPISPSVQKTLRTKPSPKKMAPGELYNPCYEPYSKGNGTLAYRDAWNLFDQVILSKAMGSRSKGTWWLYKFVVFKEPFMIQSEGDFKGYPFRTFAGGEFINGYSDHFPVYGVFLKKRKGGA